MEPLRNRTIIWTEACWAMLIWQELSIPMKFRKPLNLQRKHLKITMFRRRIPSRTKPPYIKSTPTPSWSTKLLKRPMKNPEREDKTLWTPREDSPRAWPKNRERSERIEASHPRNGTRMSSAELLMPMKKLLLKKMNGESLIRNYTLNERDEKIVRMSISYIS